MTKKDFIIAKTNNVKVDIARTSFLAFFLNIYFHNIFFYDKYNFLYI